MRRKDVNMKKLVSLLIVLAAITALCIWQKNNIEALLMFISNDEEEVNKIIEDNSKELEEKIKEYAPVIPRYFTPEEEAMIASGELSIEEATALLMGENNVAEDGLNEIAEDVTEEDIDEADETNEAIGVEEKESLVKTEPGKVTTGKTDSGKTDSGKTEPGKVTTGKTDSGKTEPGKVTTGKTDSGKTGAGTALTTNTPSEESNIIKKYTAQFYSLKAYYSGQLSSLESQAKSEYINARKNKQSGVTKTSVAAKYIGRATSLQSECDGKVSALLSNMKAELKAIGGNLSVVDTMKSAYESEKAARKAQYMNMMK